MKLVCPRLDCIVLRTLSVKLYPGATGFHLELIYGFDRDPQGNRTTLALLYRVRDRDALDENIFGKALGAIDLTPTITLRDARQ